MLKKPLHPKARPKPRPKPRYVHIAVVALLAALAIMLVLPLVLHLFDAGAGGFGPDRLNVLALAALLLMAALLNGFLPYKYLFPRFKAYQQESLEGAGKLFENLTDELRAPLFQPRTCWSTEELVMLCAERRKTSQFQFTVRCVRLAFCLVCLFSLVHLAKWALTTATLATPGASSLSLPL